MHAVTPITSMVVWRSSSQQTTDGNHEIVRVSLGCFLHCRGPSIVEMMDTKKAITMVPNAHSNTNQCERGR
eukprot:4968459-Amphidinium_carterae.1